MTWIRRHIAGVAVTLALILVAVAGGGIVLKRTVDHLGDRLDHTAGQVSSLKVQVAGVEDIKAQLDDSLAKVHQLADSIQAGVSADVSGLSASVDKLITAVQAIPALASQSAKDASAQVAALLDTAKGLVADLGRALAPVGHIGPLTVSGTARVDVHVIQPLVDDLLGLLPQILNRIGGT